ncbi:hypothetical protein GLX30_30500 [Streptomyces sp. Tu 2975]|uniref:hypothetical protein n=1 Tax=Streptomyces sp. Tu 2975 TaxID=2676871 RepID=UPI00135A22BC|nr:hypothetical protein [Streptomyces sp. Tu 2975]QIP87645.1 hypothetical protein GLX30_30500 [Streptomyces sp. Tu 2975]
MPTEPTLGEVMRRLEDVRTDLKEDFRELGSRLDSKVSMERYQLEQVARDEALRVIVERVKSIEDAREQEERDRRDEAQRLADRRAADRRLIFTAIIAPVLMLLLTVYIQTQGAAA